MNDATCFIAYTHEYRQEELTCGVMLWRAAVLLATVVAGQHTLGPLTLSSAQWEDLHVVVTNAVAVGAVAAATDCGISIVAQSTQPTRPAPADVISLAGPLGPVLKPVVTHEADARTACYRVALCGGANLYRLPDTDAVLAVYLRAGADPFNLTRDNAGAPGLDADSGAAWVASFRVDRTPGQWCPGGFSPDPTFLFDTYIASAGPGAGRLSDLGLLPTPQDLGLPAGAAPGALAAVGSEGPAARALALSWATWGHRFRVWPNARCAATPLHRDAATACSRPTCPVATLCPPGFRTQLPAWGYSCFPSAADAPTGSYLTAALASFQPATGDLVLQDGTALNAFTAWGAATPTGPPACSGPDLGTCVHGAPGTDPVCACNRTAWAGVGVAGDVACALTPLPCFSPQVAAGARSPSTVCSGHGVCTFVRDGVDWGALDPAPSAVTCVCSPPHTGPWCNTTFCGDDVAPDCGAGSCEPVPFSNTSLDEGAAAWTCVCPQPWFGPGCRTRDGPRGAATLWGGALDTGAALRAAALAATPAFSVWTTARRVAGLPSDTPPDTPLLCSGRGVATPTPGGGPPAGACVCEPGWVGPRCEWAACNHTTCGPFGRCVLDTAPDGAPVTRCACATATQDPGVVLADGPDHAPGTCTRARCGAGVLVLDLGDPGAEPGQAGYLLPNVTNVVPRGSCVCASSVTVAGGSPVASALGSTVTDVDPLGVSHTLGPFAAPVSGLPLLLHFTPVGTEVVTAYTPTAFVPDLVAKNTGLRCDAPACPRLVLPGTTQPVSGALAQPCGVDPASVDTVCVPCWPSGSESSDADSGASILASTLGNPCALSGGTGGWCDCEGALATAAGLPLPWEPPGTDTAWSPHDLLPLCVPRCRNRGVWVPAARACNCDAGTHWGPTCATPRCRVGTSGPPPGPNCTTCDAGPAWNPATGCSTCAPGYTGLGCAACAPGFWRAAGGECVSCVAAAAAVCTSPGVVGHTCGPTGPVCVCGTGYTGGPAGPCTACVSGFGRPSGSSTTCVRCSVVAGCNATFTVSASCGPPATCVCVLPGMNSRCSGCGSGFRLHNGVCAPCGTALGCNPTGTTAALCPTAVAGPRDACVCNTTAGVRGLTCGDCAPGWIATAMLGPGNPYAGAGLCVSCAAVTNSSLLELCGPAGVLDCAAPNGPVCVCPPGWAGPGCATCSGCGPGGTCAPVVGDPCVCAAGYQADATGACTLCDAGWPTPNGSGSCTRVADACGTGPGVAVAASVAAAACTCWPGWTGTNCTVCDAGHAGPACEACTGDVFALGAACVWDPAARAAHWECEPGYAGASCRACALGWNVPVPGQFQCLPCPDCGPGGVCAPGPQCECAPGYTADTPGGPCNQCVPGAAAGTLLGTCVPCPPCGPGKVCVPWGGDPAGTGSCVCRGGLRPLVGTNGSAPMVACFPPDLATTLEAHVRDPAQLAALALVGEEGVFPLPQPAVYLTPTSDEVPWAFLAVVLAMAAITLTAFLWFHTNMS